MAHKRQRPTLLLAISGAAAPAPRPPGLPRRRPSRTSRRHPRPDIAGARSRPASRRPTRPPPDRCPGLDWTLLAAVGGVESHHGASGGAAVDPITGEARPWIFGPPLNGTPGTAAMPIGPWAGWWGLTGPWQHAVGPMQFLPATFTAHAVDADHDGTTNPHDIDDAAATAAAYICTAAGPAVDGLDEIARIYNPGDAAGYAARLTAELARIHDANAAAGSPPACAPSPARSPSPTPGTHPAPAAASTKASTSSPPKERPSSQSSPGRSSTTTTPSAASPTASTPTTAPSTTAPTSPPTPTKAQATSPPAPSSATSDAPATQPPQHPTFTGKSTPAAAAAPRSTPRRPQLRYAKRICDGASALRLAGRRSVRLTA